MIFETLLGFSGESEFAVNRRGNGAGTDGVDADSAGRELRGEGLVVLEEVVHMLCQFAAVDFRVDLQVSD